MAALTTPLNLPLFCQTKLPRRRPASEHGLTCSLAEAVNALQTAHFHAHKLGESGYYHCLASCIIVIPV
jgi:hypothetical protein